MMKSVVIFLAILGVAFAGSLREASILDLENEYDGDSFSRLVSVSKRSTDNDTCTGPFSCQDCKTARLCRPSSTGWQIMRTMSCPAFCDFNSGTCTDVPNAICGGEDDDFACMQQDGKFPSQNQTVYHVCTDFIAKKFECVLDGQKYNPSTETCQEGFAGGSFDCQEKGIKVPYSTDAQYYGYCGDDLSVVVIDKCPNNFSLNVTSQNCDPYCAHPGAYADPSDSTKYIKCSNVWVGGTEFLLATQMNCPANTAFDSSQFVCVSATVSQETSQLMIE